MMAALTTLMFLTVLWMLGVLACRICAQSGSRIAAAIDGLASVSPATRSAAA